MKKLYFTRHGQTFWNVENKICGATDIALTELGHRQAVEAGQMIREAGYEIDEILAFGPCCGDGTSYQRGDRDSHADGTTVKGAEFWAV